MANEQEQKNIVSHQVSSNTLSATVFLILDTNTLQRKQPNEIPLHVWALPSAGLSKADPVQKPSS